MPVRAFRLADLPTQPWKNGGGTTQEIVRHPAGSEPFDWRASIARIGQDGPFSAYPGMDRVLVPLDGGGIRLGIDGKEQTLEALAPFRFAGESAVSCRLLAGPASDFNVMARRDRLRVEIGVWHEAAAVDGAGCGVLFAARGRWRCRDSEGSELELEDEAGVWWEGAHMRWQIAPQAPGAVLIAARFLERHP